MELKLCQLDEITGFKIMADTMKNCLIADATYSISSLFLSSCVKREHFAQVKSIFHLLAPQRLH